MLSLDIGLSALRASQIKTDIIGQNLTNASDPNYHKQVAEQVSAIPVPVGNLSLGTGVDVDQIARLRDQIIETAVTGNKSDVAGTQTRLDLLNQLQATLGTGTGSLGGDIEDFFNQLQQLAAQPQDTTLRGVVLGSARTLTDEFHSLSTAFDTLGAGLATQTGDAVKTVNGIATRIAQLNRQIRDASGTGTSPNDLLDQRDKLVNDLARQLDVRVVPADRGQVTVLAGGVPLVVGDMSIALGVSTDASGNSIVSPTASVIPLDIQGGTLGGLLGLRDQILPGYKSRLDDLASQLARQVDGIQTTGIGLSGPSTFLAGSRPVKSVTAPLSQAGLGLPPGAGRLYVSVTDQATGARTLTPVSFDPATDSLQTIATALSAVPHIQAVTNAQTGTLQILSATGYSFDFAGRPPTTLSAAGITGTTRPTAGGSYTGTANGAYTFQVSGTGTVGVTPGLKLQVTDASGASVTSLDIGQGYSPGSALTVGNGVTIALASGAANAGDSFSLPTIAQPDAGGLLTALGLGSFFQGSTAADIALQPGLAADPKLLAGSRTGHAGDATNFQRLIGLRDQLVAANGTQTFAQAYASIVGDVGTDVSDLGTLQTSQTSLGQQLATQQQSVSGVDTNEELVKLLDSQRAFQSASKYISVVNDTLTSLFGIL
jgi:flagellar hook-associated protein 1 FlgK